MKETIDVAVTSMTSVLQTMGPISGVLLVLLESIFPVLPLGVFITLNINAFGFFYGFLLSWIATSSGCMLSFFLFRSFLSKYFYRFLAKKKTSSIEKMMDRISKMPFANLVVLVALPFTPAFLINIAAGLAKMDTKKFGLSILIGKLSIVFFWGYIGKSLLESVTDIKTIIIISIILVFAYLLSKWMSKKFKIE